MKPINSISIYATVMMRHIFLNWYLRNPSLPSSSYQVLYWRLLRPIPHHHIRFYTGDYSVPSLLIIQVLYWRLLHPVPPHHTGSILETTPSRASSSYQVLYWRLICPIPPHHTRFYTGDCSVPSLLIIPGSILENTPSRPS